MIATAELDGLLDFMRQHNLQPKDRRAMAKLAFARFCPVLLETDKPNRPKGWIILRRKASGQVYAIFGNHRTGEKHHYVSGGGQHSQSMDWSLERAANEEQADAELQARWRLGAGRAIEALSKAKPCKDHSYLTKKAVKPCAGLVVLGNALLVPLSDVEGKIWSLQVIRSSKEPGGFTKRFLPKGRTNACFFQVGGIKDRVIVTEGLATALSIHEATKCACVAAMSAGNLGAVARALRTKLPLTEIIIAADNDSGTEARKGFNPGVLAATRAALEVGARLAIPAPKGGRTIGVNTDFNDLMRAKGPAAVKRCIKQSKIIRATQAGEPLSLDATSLVGADQPERRFLVDQWLSERCLAMVHAWRGAGKTMFVVTLGAHIAAGRDFLGWKIPRPAGVLWLDGELSSVDVSERLRSALASSGLPKKPFRVITPDRSPNGVVDLATEVGLKALEAELGGIEVVIVDSLSTLFSMSNGENDSRSWEPVNRFLRRMKQLHRTVILLHHDNKSGGARGHSSSETLLDVAMQLRSVKPNQRNAQLAFSIAMTKFRFKDAPAPRLATLVVSGKGKHHWNYQVRAMAERTTAKLPAAASASNTSRIIELRKAGMSVRDIAKKLDVPKSTVHRVIKKADGN